MKMPRSHLLSLVSKKEEKKETLAGTGNSLHTSNTECSLHAQPLIMKELRVIWFYFFEAICSDHMFSMATNNHEPVDSKEHLPVFTVLVVRNVKLVWLDKNVSGYQDWSSPSSKGVCFFPLGKLQLPPHPLLKESCSISNIKYRGLTNHLSDSEHLAFSQDPRRLYWIQLNNPQ